MYPVTAVVLLACWLLGVGILAVYFEVESVHCGVRVQELNRKEADLIDEIRRWELRYNGLLRPDVLENGLPEEFRGFAYPDPGKQPTLPAAADVAASEGRALEPWSR